MPHETVLQRMSITVHILDIFDSMNETQFLVRRENWKGWMFDEKGMPTIIKIRIQILNEERINASSHKDYELKLSRNNFHNFATGTKL